MALQILIVEDHEVVTKALTTMLQVEGHRVAHVSNGEKAVDLFRGDQKGEYDLVFMDFRMPGIGGLQATQRIRQQGNRVPIYLFSNYQLPPAQISSAGADGFIDKSSPSLVDDILAVLRQYDQSQLVPS